MTSAAPKSEVAGYAVLQQPATPSPYSPTGDVNTPPANTGTDQVDKVTTPPSPQGSQADTATDQLYAKVDTKKGKKKNTKLPSVEGPDGDQMYVQVDKKNKKKKASIVTDKAYANVDTKKNEAADERKMKEMYEEDKKEEKSEAVCDNPVEVLYSVVNKRKP